MKIKEILEKLKAQGIYSSSGEIRRVLKENGKSKIFDEKKRLVWAIEEGELNWLIELMRPKSLPTPKEPKEPKDPKDPKEPKEPTDPGEPTTSKSTQKEQQTGGIPWVLVMVIVVILIVTVIGKPVRPGV